MENGKAMDLFRAQGDRTILIVIEQSTFCALLSCKLNNTSSCYDLETPTELLKIAKSALYSTIKLIVQKVNKFSSNCQIFIYNLQMKSVSLFLQPKKQQILAL